MEIQGPFRIIVFEDRNKPGRMKKFGFRSKDHAIRCAKIQFDIGNYDIVEVRRQCEWTDEFETSELIQEFVKPL